MTEKKTALQRLEEMLDAKDSEIADLKERLKAEEDRRAWEWTKHRMLKQGDLPGPDGLPIPHLEIRYERIDEEGYNWQANYALVLPHFTGEVHVVPMGCTRTTGGAPHRDEQGPHAGKFYGPYRDGAHIRHDMKTLGLPGFIIVEEEADAITT